MQKIPLSQGKVALVDDGDFEFVSQWRWHASFEGSVWYAGRNGRAGEASTLKLHRVLLCPAAGEEVDHRDGDGLNCQRGNLRICTHAQNLRNQRKQVGRSSRYKGVSWFKLASRWSASIKLRGVKRHLGYFTMEEEAAAAYDRAARALFGEFARPNFQGAICNT